MPPPKLDHGRFSVVSFASTVEPSWVLAARELGEIDVGMFEEAEAALIEEAAAAALSFKLENGAEPMAIDDSSTTLVSPPEKLPKSASESPPAAPTRRSQLSLVAPQGHRMAWKASFYDDDDADTGAHAGLKRPRSLL